MNSQKTTKKGQTKPDSKPEKLAKIIYSGLLRLKAAKEAQISGRNRHKTLDFGQPERVNVTKLKIDKVEID
jgi:hypothetical protein